MLPALFSYILNYVATMINALGQVWQIPQNVFNTIDVVLGYALMFDGILPIRTALFCIYTIISFEIVLYIIKTILMITNWARGSGSIDIN